MKSILFVLGAIGCIYSLGCFMWAIYLLIFDRKVTPTQTLTEREKDESPL